MNLLLGPIFTIQKIIHKKEYSVLSKISSAMKLWLFLLVFIVVRAHTDENSLHEKITEEDIFSSFEIPDVIV